MSTCDGDWFLINASPDIHSQIEKFRVLSSRTLTGLHRSRRFSLTNGDLDHCLGYFAPRESPIVVYATDAVRCGFMERNVMFRTLRRFAGR